MEFSPQSSHLLYRTPVVHVHGSPTYQVLSMMITDKRRGDDADEPLDGEPCGTPEEANGDRDVNQLEEDRRMRRWQLERIEARSKRV